MNHDHANQPAIAASFLYLIAAGLIGLFASSPLAAQGQQCDCSCEAYAQMEKMRKEMQAAAQSGNAAGMPSGFQQMLVCSASCGAQWAECAQASRQLDPGLPKSRLTGEYLQGSWCSVHGGQEVTEYLFHADGSYQIGVPAGAGFAMQPDVRSLQEFKDRFDQLAKLDADGFTLVTGDKRHSRQTVFTRGACN